MVQDRHLFEELSAPSEKLYESLLNGSVRPFKKGTTKGQSILKVCLALIAFCMVAYYTIRKTFPNEEEMGAVISNTSDDKGLVLLSAADWNNLDGGDAKGIINGAVGVAFDSDSTKAWGSALTSAGTTAMTLLMTTHPGFAAIGGAMVLFGAILGAATPDQAAIARQKFNDDLRQNLTEIKQNQEVMIDMLVDLKNGQKLILDTIIERSASSELRDVLDTYGWTGSRGMESIASRYNKVLGKLGFYLENLQDDNLTPDEVLQQATYRAGEFAYTQFNDDLLSAFGHENMKLLLSKIKDIKGNDLIGRWTAAETFREYLVLRIQSFSMQSLAQLYLDAKKEGLKVAKWDKVEQDWLAHDLKEDVDKMEAWVNSLKGFEYPVEPYRESSCPRGRGNGRYCKMKEIPRLNNCEGNLVNDLGWEQWQVAQCIKRIGKLHDQNSRKCCEMFNTYNSTEYYMNKNTNQINKLCDWTDQYQGRDQQDCSWSQYKYQNPTLSSQEVGMRTQRDSDWSSYSQSYDGRSGGKLMCGATVKIRDSEEGDETGAVSLKFTWCSKDDWSNQYENSYYENDFQYLRKKLARDYDDCYKNGCYRDVKLMCKRNSYVYSIQASTERARGSWYDDSALGDFRIRCRKLEGNGYNRHETNMGLDGSYGKETQEEKDHFVFKAEVFAESYQGSGGNDDSAVTDVKIWTSQQLTSPDYWKDWAYDEKEFQKELKYDKEFAFYYDPNYEV